MVDILYDIVGSIFYSVGIYIFAKSADFAPGGISGIALILNSIFPYLPIGTLTLILNIPLIIFGFKALGSKFMLRSFRTMVILTIILDLIFPMLPLYTGDRFLAALFSGISLGFGLALIYRRGSSTGGMDFLTLPLKRLFPHYSIGNITLVLDAVVFSLGGFVFGSVDAILYGAIATIACSVVIDKVMLGSTVVKFAIVVTSFGDEVAKNVINSTGRGATKLKAQGAYTQKERDIILCSCANRELHSVRTAIFEIDPEAFVIITDAGQVIGEGFNSISEII